tara:strand:- start:260 stop:454 length:195 start_codon:yes stop_codon:yes gene_type:complete
MNKKIVYTQDDGTLAIVIPTPEALDTMTVEEIAIKDVPTGKEYHIVEDSEVPSDRTFRDAWTWE